MPENALCNCMFFFVSNLLVQKRHGPQSKFCHRPEALLG